MTQQTQAMGWSTSTIRRKRLIRVASLVLLSLAGLVLGQGAFAQATGGTTSMAVFKYLFNNSDPDANGHVSVGDSLGYLVQMQNTGSLPLTNVVVNDPITAPSSATCATVNPGKFCILNGFHTVTAADASAGGITNIGSATSTEIPTPVTFTLNTPINTATSQLTVVTYLVGNTDPDGNGQVTVGDKLTYKVRAINGSSTVPLTNVVVSDPILTPTSRTCASVADTSGFLGFCDLNGTYIVTATDAAVGHITNVGSATSNEIPGPIGSNTLMTPVTTIGAGMTVSKALVGNADGDHNGLVSAGDVLTYSVTATNSGSAMLLNVQVSDPLTTPNAILCTSVAVAGTCVLTGTYTVTAADVAHGSISNTGSATSTQVPGPISSTLNTAVAGSNALVIVSGNSQVLVGTTPSAPMVVLLKSASNAPIAGATINWSATNGSLTSPTSVTDATGHASNIVTPTQTGAITVHASTALATSPVTFTMSTGLANIPGLSPEAHAVAAALDEACPALAVKSGLTPAEADLLARCEDIDASVGIDGGATADALEQLVTETAAVQSNAAVTAATAQFQNINLRLSALRSRSKTSSLSGLAFAGPGGVIPLSSLMNAFSGDKDKQAGADFSRWGFFATGTIGRGSADARSLEPAYSYDINGLTAGVDYRLRDNWVSGVAVGFSRQNTDLHGDRGSVSMNGWSMSTYSTWSFTNDLYLDGVLTWGNNAFDLKRRIDYTLPVPGGGTTSIHQVATGHPDGSLFSAALTFGGDFHRNAWNFSPYAQLVSSKMDFNAYTERLQAGPGNGLGLSVNARTVDSLSSVLGAKVSWTRSADWGVFIPTASLEWQHEFKSDLSAITARFANDPTQTPFSLTGAPLDNSFFRLGLGMSFVLAHGRSGFILYEHMLGREGMSQDNLGIGFRIEF